MGQLQQQQQHFPPSLTQPWQQPRARPEMQQLQWQYPQQQMNGRVSPTHDGRRPASSPAVVASSEPTTLPSALPTVMASVAAPAEVPQPSAWVPNMAFTL